REAAVAALPQRGRSAALLPGLLAGAAPGAPPRPPRAGRPAPPLVRPGKILALGRTYREHALELGNAPPAEPLVFDKLPDALAGNGAAVAKPDPPDAPLD